VYIIYIYIHVIYVLAEREYKGDGSDSTPRVEISLLSLEKLEERRKRPSLGRINKRNSEERQDTTGDEVDGVASEKSVIIIKPS